MEANLKFKIKPDLWYMPVIPLFMKLREKEQKFKTSMNERVTLFQYHKMITKIKFKSRKQAGCGGMYF